jgi:uncharacterized protein DUF6789
MNINLGRAVAAGVVGTAAMTVVGLYVTPFMGIPPMNPALMLAGAMGGNIALGWVAHVTIGVTLATGYALLGWLLPGRSFARGALYGVAPFLLAQIAVMPLMGIPLFSGSAVMATGSLIGHLVYGAVVGGIYGEYGAAQPVAALALDGPWGGRP